MTAALALGQIEVSLDTIARDLETVKPADEDSLWAIADLTERVRKAWSQVYALKCRTLGGDPGSRITITLGDPDLVEQIAEHADVPAVDFEGLTACVVVDPTSGLVVTFQALDRTHQLSGARS